MEQRRWIVLLISFNFAIIAVLGGFVYRKHLEIEQLHFVQRYTEARLSETVAEISLAHYKGQYGTSPEVFSALLARVLERVPDFVRPEAGQTGHVAVFCPMEEAVPAASVEAAKAQAAAFTGLSQSVFTYVGNHRFRARVDGGDFVVQVCPEGGQVLWAENSREVRAAFLTVEEGLGKARTFLERNGYESMELRHWQLEAHQIAATFVSVQDGVLLYPDWVRISVGLDNGRVTGFSATTPGADQRARTLFAPVVTSEEALRAIPGELTVEGYDLVVIPVTGGREVLCYAFRTRAEDGRVVLVYVSAETGRQQDIRIRIEDETGVFVR